MVRGSGYGQRSGRRSSHAELVLCRRTNREGSGAVWVGNWHGISVSRIDPETNRVVGSPIRIGFRAGNLVVGAGGRLGHQRRPRGRRAPRTWWLCASTRRPTERSRRSPSVVTRSMSRQPRAPSGCRSQTPARRYGSPGANAASRPGCVSLSGSHDELGGTGGPPGVGGLQMRRRDRLQPIRGYERNVWPPRTRPRRSINRAKRTTQRGRSIPLRGHMASHSRLPLSPSVAPAGCGIRRYPTRLVEP